MIACAGKQFQKEGRDSRLRGAIYKEGLRCRYREVVAGGGEQLQVKGSYL